MDQTGTRASRADKIRLHDLDALRGFAMLLGIFLHASLFLIPDAWPVQDPWAYTTPPENNVYITLFFGVHGFRMPLFFLLSGYFTAMLWQRRGLRHLFDHRLQRIGLPLALGAVTVVPVTHWVKLGTEFKPAYWPFIWFFGGFDHLWFLWMLLLLAVGFMVAVKLGLRLRHWAWWGLVPLVLAPMFFMDQKSFGADTTTHLFLAPRVLGYYALFFGFGAFFHQRQMAIQWWWMLFLPLAAAVILPTGIEFLFPDKSWQEDPKTIWGIATLLQTAYTWLMCFGLLGLFRWLAAKERPWVRYLSDASYWLYLWHLALVIVLQDVLAGMAINVHVKMAIICLAVPGVLLALYEWGVRYTWIGAMLNGPRTRKRTEPAQTQTQPVPSG